MSSLQTKLGDLKQQLEDLQSVTNANIARLQKYLEVTSSPSFRDLSYKDQYEYLQSLADRGTDLKDYIREIASRLDKNSFHIFLATRFDWKEKAKLSMLADIEYARVNKTPAKEIPFAVFKAMIAEEGIPVDDRNRLIKERGDKRFKELL